jgi:hypothetical protein
MSEMNNTIHDCLVDVIGGTPDEELMIRVIKLLPAEILLLAQQWGPYDTEFRDKVFVWIRDNKKLLEGELCGTK